MLGLTRYSLIDRRWTSERGTKREGFPKTQNPKILLVEIEVRIRENIGASALRNYLKTFNRLYQSSAQAN